MVAACPFPSPQGSQVFVRDLCGGLARRGHEVHLLTYGQGDGADHAGEGLHQLAEVRHERIRRLPGDDAMRSGPTPVKPLLDVMMAARLTSMLGRGSFDVVHCHNYEAAMIGLVARVRRNVPVVYHSHNMMGDELPTYFTGALTRSAAFAAGRLLDRTVPRAVDQAIALCDHTASALGGLGVAAERLTIIPPAVDDPGECRDKREARAALGVAQNARVVTYAGNLDAYQNMGLLVGAFRLLVENAGADRPLLLVATHRYEKSFDALVSAAGIAADVKIVRAAEFGPIWGAIEAADAVVMPRRLGSGFPIKLLNYLACGRAVVTAGCGGKAVTDGVDGLVVADDDPEALSSALGRVLDAPDLAQRLGREARRTYLASFTWDAVLPAMEAVYDRAMESGTRSYRAPAM